MEILNKLDENLWRAFVDQHPHGNIFHTPEMFAVFARPRGYRPELWAAVEGGEILALHLPVIITLAGGPLALLTSRAVDFGGVLVEESDRGRVALAELLKAYDRQVRGRYLFTELRHAADVTRLREPLDQCDYHYEEHDNFLIDLTREPDDLLASFSSVRRRHIRQAERSDDLEVVVLTERSRLDEFYQLLKKTYRWARVPLADVSMFAAAFDLLVPKGMARLVMTRTGGQASSAMIALTYKGTILNWYNGTDRAFRPPIANEYLFWQTFLWGAQNGFTTMDLGGAGKPGEKYGVRDFKAKFNGRLVSFGRSTRVHAPIRLKMSQAAYESMRKAAFFLNAKAGSSMPQSEAAQNSKSKGLTNEI